MEALREAFAVSLQSITDTRVGVNTLPSTISIEDDDGVQLRVARVYDWVTEAPGASIPFCVVLEGSTSIGIPVTLQLSHLDPDGALSPAPPNPAPLTFEAGDSRVCINLPIGEVSATTEVFSYHLNPGDSSNAVRTVSGGDILGPRGRVVADKNGGCKLDRLPPSIRVVADPTDGATDAQRGRISAGSPGSDGEWDERSGGFPGVRSAPGHGAQDAGLFGAHPVTGERARRTGPNSSPSPASSTASWKRISGFPRNSATPPSASSRGSGTSTASTVSTPSSRTTSGSIADRPRRCSSRCPIRRGTASATSARPWWSSAAWSRRPTASSSTCPTATAAL